jgi:glutathione-specific gamma-glutamylcyclotransferase
MWDGWESSRGCVRTQIADLQGYRRSFNKPSVRNWGQMSAPCPTLNVEKDAGATCRGLAFEFEDKQERELLAYLGSREGRGFSFPQLPIVLLEKADTKVAYVPVYEGAAITFSSSAELAKAIRSTSGKDGACIQYVNGIAQQLKKLGIRDAAVESISGEIQQAISG